MESWHIGICVMWWMKIKIYRMSTCCNTSRAFALLSYYSRCCYLWIPNFIPVHTQSLLHPGFRIGWYI